MKRRCGQVFIISVLGIVIILFTVSSLLISTYLSEFNLPRTEFRETVNQISFSSRGALAMGLAEATKQLNLKAETADYQDFLNLDDSPTSKKGGLKLVNDWQNDTMRNFPATGPCISILPEFYCDWNVSLIQGNRLKGFGYSKALSNVSIDLLNYGFSGYEEQLLIECNATIEGLNGTTSFYSLDGRGASFQIKFVGEKGYNLKQMEKNLVNVYFGIKNHTTHNESFHEAKVKNLDLEPNGIYTIYYLTEMNSTTHNLNLLRDKINSTGLDQDIKNDFLNILYVINETYVDHDRKGAWLQLRHDLRPKLVNETATNITDILDLVDVVLSQLRPHIRVVARDHRGITVSVYGELDDPINEGPFIYSPKAYPIKCSHGGNLYLSAFADDHLGGNSNITVVEYFVSGSSSPPPVVEYGSGLNMSAIDGAFDESIEKVESEILATETYGFTLGENYVWIRAQDSNGTWGDFYKPPLKVTILTDDILHIDSVVLFPRSARWWWWRRYWIEALVTIVDGEGMPVDSVDVHGVWSRKGIEEMEEDRFTQIDGTCVFISPTWWSGHRTYTFIVDSVYKNGYTWDGISVNATMKHGP